MTDMKPEDSPPEDGTCHEREEWQTVESCPHDGTRVLLAWWDGFNKQWQYEAAPYSNLDTARRGEGFAHGRATHWKPLHPPVVDADQ